ncbi:MAG: DUF2945 domain-containing protein [Bradymonadaceae bacterium]|nr:DUF2945 domain-containing protein [Lujinxingiaceae bacterium]
MATELQEGDRIYWESEGVRVYGQIKNIFEHKITRKIDGVEVARVGSAEDPALFIIQEDGARALKLASEVH